MQRMTPEDGYSVPTAVGIMLLALEAGRYAVEAEDAGRDARAEIENRAAKWYGVDACRMLGDPDCRNVAPTPFA